MKYSETEKTYRLQPVKLKGITNRKDTGQSERKKFSETDATGEKVSRTSSGHISER